MGLCSPHLLLGGESGSGKSRVLYGLIYKFLGETTDNNICDGKEKNYTTLVSSILDLPNVGEDKRRNIWLHQRCRKFNG